MVTMREAVTAYQKRYFGNDYRDGLAAIGAKIRNDGTEQNSVDGAMRTGAVHDMFHIMSSGVAQLCDGNTSVDAALQKMDERGLVSRNAGLKAEIISDIYNVVFTTNIDSVAIFNNEVADRTFASNRFMELLDLAKQEIAVKEQSGMPLSDIPELAALRDSYRHLNSARDIIDTVVTPEELQFHVRKAVELHQKIKQKYPHLITKSFKDLSAEIKAEKPDDMTRQEYERPQMIDKFRLLDLPIEEFSIDNFIPLEKAKLAAAVRGTGDLPGH